MRKHLSSNKSSESPLRRVIFAWNCLEWGGAQMYFLGIARRIMDRCEVRFIFPAGTDPQFVDFCKNAGFGFEYLDRHADLGEAAGIGRKIARHFRKVRAEIALVRAVARSRSEGTVFHIELSPWQSVSALWFLCRRGPVFSTVHNRLPRVARWRDALWRLKLGVISRLRRFHMFPSNRDARESLRPYVVAEFLERTRVTFTNVDPDEISAALASEFDREAARERFGVSKDAFLVVTVGQFIDRKGRWDALEAAKILAGKGENVSFLWVSNSGLDEADRLRVESYGLGGRFRIVRSADVGPDHLDLMRFLRIADVFALPSHVEGLPISILEAMSLGIPTVSTRVNAIPEAIIDGDTGLLVAAGDPEALSVAITRLKMDGKLRERIGAAGREKVLREFTETEVAEIAFEEYTKALNV